MKRDKNVLSHEKAQCKLDLNFGVRRTHKNFVVVNCAQCGNEFKTREDNPFKLCFDCGKMRNWKKKGGV